MIVFSSGMIVFSSRRVVFLQKGSFFFRRVAFPSMGVAFLPLGVICSTKYLFAGLSMDKKVYIWGRYFRYHNTDAISQENKQKLQNSKIKHISSDNRKFIFVTENEEKIIIEMF